MTLAGPIRVNTVTVWRGAGVMVIEGVGRLDTSPWVRLFNDARVRCVETPMRPNWVDVNIG